MKTQRYTTRFLSAGLLSVVVAFANFTLAASDPEQTSGFLDPSVESKLEKVKISDGKTVMRWQSPELNKSNYDAVMIDRVIFYPAPNPGPQVSSKTLEEVSDYLTSTLRRDIGESVKVVDEAGKRVLRMQPAITAVVVKQEGLSAKDILPVHLLFSAVSSVAGKRDENVTAAVEVRITDSMSGDYRAAVKRKIEGQQLENKDEQMTLDTMKKTLDEGAAAGALALKEALAQ